MPTLSLLRTQRAKKLALTFDQKSMQRPFFSQSP